MRVTSILGREEDFAYFIVDELWLSSADLTRRIFRKKTKFGREMKASLPRGCILRPGDVLAVEDDHVIVVRVDPQWLLTIRPTGFAQQVEVAHQLGNRHIPIQVNENEILVQYLPVLERLCEALGVAHEKVYSSLDKPFLHVFAPHVH